VAKYRGQVDGKTRGKYVEAELHARFLLDEYNKRWPPEEYRTPMDDVRDYMRRRGVFVDERSDYDERFDRTKKSAIYHFAGSTVFFGFVHRTKPGDPDLPSHWIPPQARIGVHIYANGPADDVIEKLQKDFPYLEENRE
jgi:hypothetical protein